MKQKEKESYTTVAVRCSGDSGEVAENTTRLSRPMSQFNENRRENEEPCLLADLGSSFAAESFADTSPAESERRYQLTLTLPSGNRLNDEHRCFGSSPDTGSVAVGGAFCDGDGDDDFIHLLESESESSTISPC